MSHFTITVAVPEIVEADQVYNAVDSALAGYCETSNQIPHLDRTRAELIAEVRALHESIRTTAYAQYCQDPDAYAATATETQVAWFRGDDADGGFPAALGWTDDQIVAHERDKWGSDLITENGDCYSFTNPEGKWDWWTVGGRWGGAWTLRKGAVGNTEIATEPSAFGLNETAADPSRTDCARKCDLIAETVTASFAYIDLYGQWHEQGTMGWFGMVSGEQPESEWDEQYQAWFASLPDATWLVNIDAHV